MIKKKGNVIYSLLHGARATFEPKNFPIISSMKWSLIGTLSAKIKPLKSAMALS